MNYSLTKEEINNMKTIEGPKIDKEKFQEKIKQTQ